NGEGVLAELSLGGAMLIDFLEFLFQPRDARANDAAIQLQLRLTDAARSDAARLPLEVSPCFRQSRQHVLELRQLDLRARFAAARTAREDVENQRAPIDHFHLGDLLEIANLRGRKIVVENDERHAMTIRKALDLFRFSFTDERRRIGSRTLGDNRGDDVSARGFDEFSELLEMFVGNAARQIRED